MQAIHHSRTHRAARGLPAASGYPGYLLLGLLAGLALCPVARAASPGSAASPPFAGEQAQSLSPALPDCNIDDLLRWNPADPARFECVAAVVNCPSSRHLLQVSNGALHCKPPTRKQQPPPPPPPPPAVVRLPGIFSILGPLPPKKNNNCSDQFSGRIKRTAVNSSGVQGPRAIKHLYCRAPAGTRRTSW